MAVQERLQDQAIPTVSKTPEKTKIHTHPDRSPRPYLRILRVLQKLPRIPHDTMDRKCRQPHTSDTLKDRPLRHDRPIILNCRDMDRLRRRRSLLGSQRRASGIPMLVVDVPSQPRIPLVRLVSFVADVANQVGPGDAVCTANEPRVGDGAE
jgi:hypothetical protein